MAELESEGAMTRNEVAEFLREFAAELGDGVFDERSGEFAADDATDRKRITLIVGGESATVTVPHAVEFDVEVESRSPIFGSGVRHGIDFQLSWKIDDPEQLDEDWIEVE